MWVAADGSFVSGAWREAVMVIPADDAAVAAAIGDGVRELGVRGRGGRVGVRVGRAGLPGDDDAVVVEDGDGFGWLLYRRGRIGSGESRRRKCRIRSGECGIGRRF